MLMLSQSDKQWMETKFVTKTYLKKTLANFVTKRHLNEKLKKELSNYLTKNEFLKYFDQLMGELKAMREEIAIGFHQVRENYDRLENHEVRIEKL